MFNYGFVNPRNKVNTEELDLPEPTWLHDAKIETLGSDFMLRLGPQVEPFNLLRIFRVLEARTAKQISNAAHATSWVVEYRALAETCHSIIGKHLSSYPTTLGYDVAVLDHMKENRNFSNIAFWRRWTALTYRIDQKRIFFDHLWFCDRALEDVLFCTPRRAVSRPRYFRELAAIRNHLWNEFVDS